MSEVHDDPLREAAAAVIAIGSELAAVISAVQALQLRLIGVKPDKDAPLSPDQLEPEPAVKPDPRVGQAAARFAWEPALREEWLATANPVETARVWAAALPFAAYDTTAAEAMARSEARLEEIHPEAMDHYRQLRAEGRDAADAMLASTPIFDQPSAAAQLGADPLVPASAVAVAATADEALSHDLSLDRTATVDLGADAPLAEGLGRDAPAARHSASPHRSRRDPAAGEAEAEAEAGIEAPDTPGLFEDPPAPAAELGEAAALQHAPQDQPGPLLGADEPPAPDLSAGADPPTFSAEAEQYLAYADHLKEVAPTSASPDAVLAAESVMRNFPTANEAVDRVPRPKPPSSSPAPKKRLVKRLGRGRR